MRDIADILDQEDAERQPPPNDNLVRCPPMPLIEHLKWCRIMLYQHGILTDSEKERTDRRINKKESLG